MSVIEELFDSWDPDRSGTLEIKELQSQLRRRDVELNAALRAGAAGEIVLESKNKTSLRKDKIDANDSNLLQGLDLDESSDKSYAEQVGFCLCSMACAADFWLPSLCCR